MKMRKNERKINPVMSMFVKINDDIN